MPGLLGGSGLKKLRCLGFLYWASASLVLALQRRILEAYSRPLVSLRALVQGEQHTYVSTVIFKLTTLQHVLYGCQRDTGSILQQEARARKWYSICCRGSRRYYHQLCIEWLYSALRSGLDLSNHRLYDTGDGIAFSLPDQGKSTNHCNTIYRQDSPARQAVHRSLFRRSVRDLPVIRPTIFLAIILPQSWVVIVCWGGACGWVQLLQCCRQVSRTRIKSSLRSNSEQFHLPGLS